MTADVIAALCDLEAGIPLATADTLASLRKLEEDVRRHDAETAAMAAELKRRADLMSRRGELIAALCGRATPTPAATPAPEPVAPAAVAVPAVVEPAVVEPPAPPATDEGNLSGWRACPWADLEITNPTILKALGESQLTEIGEVADALRLTRAPFGLSEHHADYLASMIDGVAADDPSHTPILTADAHAQFRAEPPVEAVAEPLPTPVAPPPAGPPVMKGEPIAALGVTLSELENATSLGCADYGKPLKVKPVAVNGRRYVVAGSVIGGQKYRTYDVLPLYTLAEFRAKHPAVSTYSMLSHPSPGVREPGDYGGLMVTVRRGNTPEVLVVGVKGEQRRLLWEAPKGGKQKVAPKPKAKSPPPPHRPVPTIEPAPSVVSSPAPDPTPAIDEPFCRPGDVVRTSYGTGPYVVKSIDRVPMLLRYNRPCYNLTVADAHDAKTGTCFLNNYQRQADGRIDALNGDELVVLPAGTDPGPTYFDWLFLGPQEQPVEDAKGNADLQRRWMNGHMPAPPAAEVLLADVPRFPDVVRDALDRKGVRTVAKLMELADPGEASARTDLYTFLQKLPGVGKGPAATAADAIVDRDAPSPAEAAASPGPVVCRPLGELVLAGIDGLTHEDLSCLSAVGIRTLGDLGRKCEQLDARDRAHDVGHQIGQVLDQFKGAFTFGDVDRIVAAVTSHLKLARPQAKAASPSLATIGRLTPQQLALLAAAGLKTVADLGEACEQVRLKKRMPASVGDPAVDSGIYSFLREKLGATEDTYEAVNAVGDVLTDFVAQEAKRGKADNQPAKKSPARAKGAA